MAKVLDHQLFDHGLRLYLEVTTPVFDLEMGKRMKNIREKMELTQKELAERLGFNQTVICRLETGRQTHAPCNSAHLKNVFKDDFQYLILAHGYYRYEEIKYRYNKQIKKEVGSKA